MLGFAADNFPCRHTPSSVKHCGTALRNGTATYGRAGKATGTPSAARVAARSANGSNGNAAEVSLKICIYLYIYEKKKKKKKETEHTHTPHYIEVGVQLIRDSNGMSRQCPLELYLFLRAC